jgi:hypothetical protein
MLADAATGELNEFVHIVSFISGLEGVTRAAIVRSADRYCVLAWKKLRTLRYNQAMLN